METGRLGTCTSLTNLDKKTLLVILDTNFLIYMAEGLIAPSQIINTLNRKYQLITLKNVIDELNMLSNQKRTKIRRLAEKSLELIEKLNIIILECINEDSSKYIVDDLILLAAKYLKNNGYTPIIATCDKSMRRRSRLLGIPTLYYRRSEKLLETDWLPP